MNMSVGQPVDTLHGGGVALACALDGAIYADSLHGLFAADTRVLSTFRLSLGGIGLDLLSRSREGHGTARWHYQNHAFRANDGDVPAGSVLVVLRRRVDGAMHDDLQLTSYLGRRLRTTLAIQLDADFADLFEVKNQRLPPRVAITRIPNDHGLYLGYQRGHFSRGLHVGISTSEGSFDFVGARVAFDIELDSGATWSCCLDVVPEIDGDRHPSSGDLHDDESPPLLPVHIDSADVLAGPFRTGCADLDALSVSTPSGSFLAGGVPWFVALFGRDQMVAALMSGMLGTGVGREVLASTGSLQADTVDDWRDAQPGKLPHELRVGELAYRNEIPHTPYYGTHDASTLYCLLLWNEWRWTGDRRLLDLHLSTAMDALRWCDEYGDEDADGFQEYRTRSRAGYHDQGWKDAGDAIVSAAGEVGSLPLATVELQGYLYTARLAMAELLDEIGDGEGAAGLRAAATDLADRVEARFFMEDEGFYALALDGNKELLTAIASNAGHLLWCGLPAADRAARVASRLLRADMFSGWGLRTLSSDNPAYNPLSYQRGSVWPHDTALAAAGLARYGHRHEAAQLLHAVLDAARSFEGDRLPELFCGFDRSNRQLVPYADANVPQAWAAATPVLAAQLFLGLVPDAPRRRCFIDPWLPEWLPHLQLDGVRVGDVTVDFLLSRHDGRLAVNVSEAAHLEVVRGSVSAPLWGRPGASKTDSA